jgi:hypothetical protein
MSGYAKNILAVLEDCDRALQAIAACRSPDGLTCAPNAVDFEYVAIARKAIRDYCYDQNIKLHKK